MSTEKDDIEYLHDTTPPHVAHHLRQQARERALKTIERKDRPCMDNDEMLEMEVGQVSGFYNFFR